VSGRRDPARERAHFEDVVARRGALYWAERTAAGKRRRDLRGALVARAAEAVAGRLDRVLEIGCGTGEYTRPLAAATPATVIAVDVTPAALLLARPDLAANVRLVAADVECLPFPDCSFDAVVGNAILHHLRLGRAVREIMRVVRPAGALAFAEPNMLNPHVALERNVRWIGRLLDNSPGETAFMRWRLCRNLRALGLTEVRARPFDFLYPLTPARLVPLVERLGRVLERTPLVAEVAGSLLITARKPA
jgi:SAM-dependent methyltransferase